MSVEAKQLYAPAQAPVLSLCEMRRHLPMVIYEFVTKETLDLAHAANPLPSESTSDISKIFGPRTFMRVSRIIWSTKSTVGFS